jgi:phosphoglycerate dehydrogenase-like enzyme
VAASERAFRVAFTGDFFRPDGSALYQDYGAGVLDACPGIKHTRFAEHRHEMAAEQVGDVQAIVVLSPKVTAASLAKNAELLAICRFGVGYDSVDVPACTEADVALVTAVGSVDRSVAEATVGWMLALSHHFRTKDRLVREGRWGERSDFMGCELRDRTLGVVGVGGIGRMLVKLLAGFGMRPPLAFDPFLTPEAAAQIGVTLVPLEELMAQSDFVSVHCPLNESTRNLIGRQELALMRPTAYIINTARGGIINEDALDEVLSAGKIAGAALDCFVGEPLTEAHRFGRHENVLLAPHCIAWTDEMFRDMGHTICRAIVELAQGRRPLGVINPAVLERPGFQAKWERYRLS